MLGSWQNYFRLPSFSSNRILQLAPSPAASAIWFLDKSPKMLGSPPRKESKLGRSHRWGASYAQHPSSWHSLPWGWQRRHQSFMSQQWSTKAQSQRHLHKDQLFLSALIKVWQRGWPDSFCVSLVSGRPIREKEVFPEVGGSSCCHSPREQGVSLRN